MIWCPRWPDLDLWILDQDLAPRFSCDVTFDCKAPVFIVVDCLSRVLIAPDHTIPDTHSFLSVVSVYFLCLSLQSSWDRTNHSSRLWRWKFWRSQLQNRSSSHCSLNDEVQNHTSLIHRQVTGWGYPCLWRRTNTQLLKSHGPANQLLLC